MDIQVQYQYVDGAHFFTSDDERAAGLCAASTDYAAAYSEVRRQLNVLVGEAATFAITKRKGDK